MPQERKIPIALIDDHLESRERLAEVLNLFEEVEVVWTASSASETLQKIDSHSPVQLLLLDIEMPRVNGIQLCKEIRSRGIKTPILMLSVSDREEYLEAALKSGADGYLLKGESPRVIIRMIKDACEGRLAFSPEMARKTLDMLRSENSPQAKPMEQYGLTPREREVLAQLIQGKTYQDIAESLIISPLTVRSHIENLYRKTEVHNKAELVALAYQNKWSL